MHDSDDTGLDFVLEISRLKHSSVNGNARHNALQVLLSQTSASTSVVEYQSRGYLVIIGEYKKALAATQALQGRISQIMIIDPVSEASAKPNEDTLYLRAEVAGISGYLGKFGIKVFEPGSQTIEISRLLGRDWEHVDLILDLLPQPVIKAEIPPPGYYATRGNPAKLAHCLTTIPDMVGDFEKPRYYDYDPSICAHARNKMTACTRCIDACPTLAIRSIGERIEVDPYLCQGGGSCAAACPSGAIRYIYPELADILARLRTTLKAYRSTGGQDARLVLFDNQQADKIYELFQGQNLAENLIPIVLDELGAIDLAIMLNAIAYGASQIIIVPSPETAPRIYTTLESQQSLARAFLRGLGYSPDRIILSESASLATLTTAVDIELAPANYASFSDKRTMIRLALEYLHKHAPLALEQLELVPQAPFGEIQLDRDACTLCLACTGVCPTRALVGGGESPTLSFIEDLCVQCGLCEQTCPEHAIQRHSRYLFDEDIRRGRRELHQEAIFQCIACGKPFASQKLIERMLDRLSGHWMFTNERARRRLQMCEDCRIADMWDEQQH